MDEFDQRLPWLAETFIAPDLSLAKLSAAEQAALRELASRWKTPEKIVLLKEMETRYGEALCQAIEKYLGVNTREGWRKVGEEQSTRGIEDFLRCLWEPLSDQGFKFTMRRTPEGMQMDCRQCPHADWARSIGFEKIGYALICSGDPHMVAGFNPKIGFRRTKTLMQGDDYCDHFYYYIDNSEFDE